MKKTRIFAVLAAMAMGLAVFGCSNGDSDSSESGSTGGSTSGNGTGSEGGSTGGSTSGSIEPVAENFVKIPAISIAGTEKWTPESEVFVSGRKLEIGSFYMSDHEVTRGEYKAVMGSDPSTAKAYGKDGKLLTGDDVKNNPVNNISWYDALVYCNTRSIKENLTPCYAIGGKTDPKDWGEVSDEWDAATCDFTADGYRLPSEAEWEWAARGGESYKYAGSDNANEVAWYTGWEEKKGTGDVKSKKANAYGLYDMSGNVLEWWWDWYSAVFSDTPAAGPASGSYRCQRGGSWSRSDYYARVAYRSDRYPYNRNDYYGFRLVRSASGTTGGTTSGSGSESGSTGGTTSGSGTTGGSTSGSGSGSESDSTGGTTSGSIEPVAENFVKIPAASIAGTEEWTPKSYVFVSGRKLEIASFYMSDHEVTRGEYKALMESDPSTAKAYDKDGNELTGDDAVKNNPVNYISWYDVLVYCNKLSIKEGLTPCYKIDGKTDPSEWGEVPTLWNDTWGAATCDFTANGYRLPTEAEWEWAARGDKEYTYAGSDTIDEVAWYCYNTNFDGTRDVKTKKKNAYGLYDMSGNVKEWCWDRYYNISAVTASSGPDSGSSRCLRGGSWSSFAPDAQVYDPDKDFPHNRNNYPNRGSCYGFRLVRNAN